MAAHIWASLGGIRRCFFHQRGHSFGEKVANERIRGVWQGFEHRSFVCCKCKFEEFSKRAINMIVKQPNDGGRI